MELLDNPIRTYSWGSRTSIAAMQGRAFPTPEPEAELWMGAHPDSPSTVRRDGRVVRLDDVLDGSRLPFMLKVLAAEQPLSLQAHPNAETAARRYAEEASLPAAERLYTDPYPKPELLVAVEDFDALCGFRDPSLSAEVLDSLRVEELAPVLSALRTGSSAVRLRTAVDTLLHWPIEERGPVVRAFTVAARQRGLDYLAALGERFPTDMGVVVALLCNRVRLQPDEAIWMPDGNLHAYLRGTGMEVLAASDNVLRGGFTGKRVAVDELLRVLTFEVLADPVVKPVAVSHALLTWPVPVDDFALTRATVTVVDGAVTVGIDGPRIVFCERGTVTVDDGTTVALRSGQAGFGDGPGPVAVRGDGVVFIASAGKRHSE